MSKTESGILLVALWVSLPLQAAAQVQPVEEPTAAFQAGSPAEAEAWRGRARPVLKDLLRLDRIPPWAGPDEQRVTLGKPEDLGTYTRQDGRIWTEPDVQVPFWLLRPKGPGPFPVAVLPHGHDQIGRNTYAGIARDPQHADKIRREDRDVAVQAAEKGFVAIAPVVRGFGELGLPASLGRADSTCVSAWHHHPCNIVPGMLRFGEFWDVHGLIAPRWLLLVHGQKDPLFPADEIHRSVEQVRRIYDISGAGDRFDHRWGPEGHRFYKDLMWPFIDAAMAR